MKAFAAAIAAMIIIAVGAHYTLTSLGMSSQATYQSANVRLGE